MLSRFLACFSCGLSVPDGIALLVTESSFSWSTCRCASHSDLVRAVFQTRHPLSRASTNTIYVWRVVLSSYNMPSMQLRGRRGGTD